MSSVTSSFAQKAGRTKNLLAIADVPAVGGDNNTLNAFVFTAALTNPSIPLSSVALSTFNSYTVTSTAVAANTLLRDTGRQIVVFNDAADTTDPTGKPIASPTRDIFRQCAIVSGSEDEGIGSTVNLWVKVYSDVTPYIYFARTG